MKATGTVSDIIARKGGAVWAVSPDTAVYDALAMMAEKNVGALLVLDGERLMGLMSERDYARKIVLLGKTSKRTRVREIMSEQLVCVTPRSTVEECMRLMTDKRIRHLPVKEGDQVLGIVSIGDLVNWIILAQESIIDQLEGYIAGQYPT
jgi:CBS domain-containing protein